MTTGEVVTLIDARSDEIRDAPSLDGMEMDSLHRLTTMRVLIVEDDLDLSRMLALSLRRQGYAVDEADSGSEGLWLAMENDYDGIVLDGGLPPPDGFSLVSTLRSRERWAPVLMLTARDAVQDRVRGLDAGADDYMSKPFALTELHARLRAVIRRGPQQRPAVLQVGSLVLDPAARTARRGDVVLLLTATEFSLLHEFMRNPDVALTRSHLLAHVWDFDHEGDSNIVDVFVRSLRSKIDRPFRSHHLQTVRGFGYRLASSPTDGDRLDLSE